jgi:hypothetical protein
MGIIQASWEHFIIAERERLIRRAFLSLTIAIVAAIAGFLMIGASAVASFTICGDNSDCGQELSAVWIPTDIFEALAALCALIVIFSLLRVLVLFGLALKRSGPTAV